MDIVEALEERDAARAVERVRAFHERTLDLIGSASGGRRGKASDSEITQLVSMLSGEPGGAARRAASRGGVLIRDQNGALLGAVGVSGDRPDKDEECAAFGVRAAGLVAESE